MATVRSLQVQTRQFYLVHWPGEDSVSVVPGQDITAEGQKEIGQTCSVRIGRKMFPGKIASIGRKEEMEKLENAYLKGEYTPFQEENRAALQEMPATNPLGQLPPPSSPQPQKRKRKAGKENEKENKKPARGQHSSIVPKKSKGQRGKEPSKKSKGQRGKKDPSVPTGTILKVSHRPSVQQSGHTVEQKSDQMEETAQHTSVMSNHVEETTVQVCQRVIENDTINLTANDLGTVDMDLDTSASSGGTCTCSSSSSDSNISESDPLQLEMTVQGLEHRLVTVEENQKEILKRLTLIEQALKVNTAPEPIQNWMQDIHSDSFEQHDEYESYDDYIRCKTAPIQSHSPSAYQPPIQNHSPHSHLNSYFQSHSPHNPYLASINSPSSYQPLVQNIGSLHPSCNLQQPYSQGTHQFYSPSNPLPIKDNGNSLPSSEIQKEKLESAAIIIATHPKLKVESKIGTLAVKLAHKAFFGPDVMAKCTVQGVRDCPGLPLAELGKLKLALFRLFPQYWPNPAEFESLWSTCIESLGQACKRLRSK